MTTAIPLAPFGTGPDLLPADARHCENDPSATVWRPSRRWQRRPADLDADPSIRSSHGRRWLSGPL
jgi:predicted alpha/beta hydrolase